jgi:predicted metal-binding membrane protein
VIATLAQWGLESAGLISTGMTSKSAALAGAILLSAGFYQFTPLKGACLRHCQSPLFFLSSNWRSGVAGAFHMGAVHGAYCLGCCWFLMALLFIGGVMNLTWVAGIAIYVALEKLLVGAPWLSRGVGAIFVMLGGFVLIRTI